MSDSQQHDPNSFRAGLLAAAEIVGNMRQSEAGIFDAAHSGQRGEDRSSALYDAYQTIRQAAVLETDKKATGQPSESSAIACGTCRFWVRGSNQPRNAKTFSEDGGECRCNPPQGGHFHVYQDAQGDDENLKRVSIVAFPFPPTHCLDWCGEWMPTRTTPLP